MASTFWNPPTPETDEGWKSDAAIWVDPGRQGGSPCLMGTRIPVHTVAHWCGHEGESVDGFMSGYDIEDRRSILAACAFWALFLRGTSAADRRQQKAWGAWADAAWTQMRHDSAEATASMPDPPQSAKW